MISTSHCALLLLLLLVVSSRAWSVPGTDDDAALESSLLPRFDDERQLRQSILCRCVADDETFYTRRRLNKYYQYNGSVKAGPKSVFMSSDRTSDEDQDDDAAPTPSPRNMRSSGGGRSMSSVFGSNEDEDESSSNSGPRGSSMTSSGPRQGNGMMRVMSVFGNDDETDPVVESNARAQMRMNRGMRNMRPMSVFGMDSAGRTNPNDDEATDTDTDGYYEPQSTSSSARLGADGFYIVNGITVLPADDQACMVSQTNAALRAFLELMYRPQDTTSRSEFWDLFHSRRRLTEESANESKERELRGWEERRKRAQQNRRKKNMRDRDQYDTDLSGGTTGAADFVPRAVPTVFPCPNALPVVPPSVAPTPATDAPVATETDSPVAMETETPTLEPSDNIIASDFPSLTPSTNIETLNPTSLPTFSVEPTPRGTRRPTMRMRRTLAPVAPTPAPTRRMTPVAPTPAPTRRIMSVLPPPTRRPSGRMMRTPRPVSIAPSSFTAAPSPGPSVTSRPSITSRPSGSTVPVFTPPVDTPLLPPVDTPLLPPVDTPLLPPVDTPLLPPVDTPLLPPVDTPLLPPVDTPLLPPVDTPLLPPVDTPIFSPESSPVLFPFASPLFSPAIPPVPDGFTVPPEPSPVLFPFVTPFFSPGDPGATPAPVLAETVSPNATDAPIGNATDAPIGNATDVPIGNATNAPGNGTSAPGSGTAAPGSGTAAPGNGTDALIGNATSAPGNGTSAPGSGTAAPGNGTVPGNGTTPSPTPFVPQQNITLASNDRSEETPLQYYEYAYDFNDRCDDAVELTVQYALHRYGSNINATMDANESCGAYGGVDNLAPGVWYYMVGTGGAVSVDTCAPRTDFNTAIQVFRGDCGSLQCLVDAGSDSDDTCRSSRASEVTFSTVEEEIYHIYVFGRSADDLGTFVLSLIPV